MERIMKLCRLVMVFTVGGLMSAGLVEAASNVQGSINGQVTANGSPVTNASVTIENLGTGLSRTEQVDAGGRFSIQSLPVGQYRVTAAASGQPNAVREPVTVNVGTGTTVNLAMGADAAELERVTVSGTSISPIDISSTESATILGEQTVDRIPVGRNVTSVALLAPGTTRGDSDFGSLASFGGSTVGENVCYINGLNVTDFNNGLGCSTVPFEFYQEFQLKTGGYSAEFGRSTGGVINAVTKSGTNDFKYGFNMYYTPWVDGLSGTNPNVYYQDGNLYIDNEDDESESLEANLWASGPIMKDKLFFFVLYNPRDLSTTNQARGEGIYLTESKDIFGVVSETDDSSAFWGTKLDFNITSDHIVELTAFSDERDIDRSYYLLNNTSLARGGLNSSRVYDQGGTNWALRYTGYMTPDLTLSVMYGENERNNSSSPDDPTIPRIVTYGVAPSGSPIETNHYSAGGTYTQTDTREATRVDAEWFLGDHALRFGIDFETNTSVQDTRYSGTGGVNWITGQPFPLRAGHYYQNRGSYWFDRVYYNPHTEFETQTNAFYVEDKWQVADDLVLSLGLRNEAFKNSNSSGEAFIDIKDQIAPRLGVAWDALGDGTLKVFANYGRYFLPVATNTNVRLAGQEYYMLSAMGGVDADGDGSMDVDANGIPIITGPLLGNPAYLTYYTYADGLQKETTASVDQDIDPMFQDEFIIGFTKDLGNNWSVGVRGIRRDLASTIEDIAVDAALLKYAQANGHNNFDVGGFDYYVLTNPGEEVTIDVNFDQDINGDGVVDHGDQNFSQATPERITIDSLDAGFPKSERYYNAIELLFERAWDGVWFMQGSYTWAQSYGNNEGFVRSDNAQTDAGLTTLFDQPGLLDGAYGYLPNDRRHAFKLFGAYQLADNWQMGANLLLESGRPVNAFGNHPTDAYAYEYGSESFYQNGIAVPRGSRGTTPFRSQVDFSVKYMQTFGRTDMTLGLDIFNVFNSQVATEVQEIAEFDFTCDLPNANPGNQNPNLPANNCTPNPSYGLSTDFQAPRSMRLFAQFTF